MALASVDDPGTAPRVALIHDFLLDMRGAERVFLELCAMWPEADLFTTVYDEDGTEGRFAHRTVHTSFLQRLRPSARTFRAMLPLYPAAIESFDLSAYDLVVSSSSAWAHAVLCGERSVHVSYCHNPFRYAWSDRYGTLERRRDPISRAALERPVQPLAPVGLDRRAADRSLRRQLAGHPGADPHLLRTRVRGRLPAGGGRPLRPRPGGRPLRDRLRAHAPQADRRGHRGLQSHRPPAGRGRRRPGEPSAAPRRRSDGLLHRAAPPTPRSSTWSARPAP